MDKRRSRIFKPAWLIHNYQIMGFMPIAPTELFAALADATRRAIFERLAGLS
jgi:hypothetical protein